MNNYVFDRILLYLAPLLFALKATYIVTHFTKDLYYLLRYGSMEYTLLQNQPLFKNCDRSLSRQVGQPIVHLMKGLCGAVEPISASGKVDAV